MTPEDRQEIITEFNKALDRRRGEDIQHKEHHAFVSLMIEKERIKQQRWEAIRRQVLGWGVIVLLSGIGYAMYDHLVNAVAAVSKIK